MGCRDIEQYFAAYVDGQEGPERGAVESHLERCAPCRSRVASERVAHELLRERRDRLRCHAPDALRHRCAASRRVAAPPPSRVRRTLLPLSLAATLVLAVGVLVLFGIGTTAETYAAQLALDHRKCFQFAPESGAADAAALGRTWQAGNGWPLKVAASTPAEHLELVAVRRCGSTHGRVAHLLYRWNDEPVSMYVLNTTIEKESPVSGDQSVYKLGEHAIIWSARGRTYAVVARRQVPDLARVAGLLRQTVE